jgi:hemoglobin
MHELDRASIRRMVDDFYGRVREDALLGPVFEARVNGRWPEHLDRMVDFWSAALLREPGYSGNPRAVHARLEGVDPSHFRRWLELFAQTLDALFPASLANDIHLRAQAMAGGLLSARGYGRHHLQMRTGDER